MSKHGKLSEDSTRLSVVIPKWVKAELQRMAKADKRKLSAFTNLKLQEIVGNQRIALPSIKREVPEPDSATLGTPAEPTPPAPPEASASELGLILARELRRDGRTGNQGTRPGARAR